MQLRDEENRKRLKEANKLFRLWSASGESYDFGGGDGPNSENITSEFVGDICCLACDDVEDEGEMVVCELVLTRCCKSA